MSHSYIFSFDTLKLDKKLNKIILLLAIFLVFGFFHLIIHLLDIVKIEEFSWNISDLQFKMQTLRDHASRTEIDVLFIGGSAAGTGLNPKIFDAEYKKLRKNEIFSFNAAINGINIHEILIKDIYTPISKPKTIIYAISMHIFKNSPELEFAIKQDIKNVMDSGYNLNNYRLQLNNYIMTKLEFPNLDMTSQHVDPLTPDLDQRGFTHLKGAFPHPLTATRFSSKIPGRLLTSFENTILWCKENNIRMIVLNMPVGKTCYSNIVDGNYYDFVAQIKEVIDKHDVIFWNINDEFNFLDEEFFDLAHLNINGASKLSKIVSSKFSELNTIDELFFKN